MEGRKKEGEREREREREREKEGGSRKGGGFWLSSSLLLRCVSVDARSPDSIVRGFNVRLFSFLLSHFFLSDSIEAMCKQTFMKFITQFLIQRPYKHQKHFVYM